MMLNIDLDLQIASKITDIPSMQSFVNWIRVSLPDDLSPPELTIRIVDKQEMISLNTQYRHQSGPTNVLAFPFENPPGVELPILGDIVICAPKVVEEANEQDKPIEMHFAHLTIHGCLHLLGYDHITEHDADIMEALEIKLMQQLGFPNPYGVLKTDD